MLKQLFTEQTAALSDYEERVLLPVIIAGLKVKHGVSMAVKNEYICHVLTNKGYKNVTPARVRKIINHIRLNRLIPGLVASSKGYWVEKDPVRLRVYINSLNDRCRAIEAVAKALEKDLQAHQPSLFNTQ